MSMKIYKNNEALSPKLANKKKIQAYDATTDKLKGFEELGACFSDIYGHGSMIPAGSQDKVKAQAMADKELGDFDDYIKYSVEFDDEGGPDGEEWYLPVFKFKPEFMELDTEDGNEVLSMLSDAIYNLMHNYNSKSESNVDETTFKQVVDSFIECAPSGGWGDYWEMQQDWAAYIDGLCRDGSITQRQYDNFSNPCTPETFDRWQKRNGLTRRPRAWDESKKNETTYKFPKDSQRFLSDVTDMLINGGSKSADYYENLVDELCDDILEMGQRGRPIKTIVSELLDGSYKDWGNSRESKKSRVKKHEGFEPASEEDEAFLMGILDKAFPGDIPETTGNSIGVETFDFNLEAGGILNVHCYLRPDVISDPELTVSSAESGRYFDETICQDLTDTLYAKKLKGFKQFENLDIGSGTYCIHLLFDVSRDALDAISNEPDVGKAFRMALKEAFSVIDAAWKPYAHEILTKGTKYITPEEAQDSIIDSRTPLKDYSESKKSEATKFGAGMATRKDFSKTKNLGEIFDVLDEHLKSLKAASEDMSKSKEDLEASIKKLQEFEGYTDFLKQQSVKGIKKALTLKNSPEVQAASEIEKNLKDALSVIMSDYKNVTDVTQLMVVIDSKYATRGSQILTTLEGQVSRAIDVDMKTIKDSIESGDITEDDVMKLVTMTSVSKGMKNKDTATKVKPVLERMNAMLESASKVEEAIIDPQQFKELRDLVEQIVNEASTPKETIKTTVTALDKETISTVPESKDGGLLGKLKEFVKDIKDKIAGLWDSFTSLFFSIEDDALEASDVFDEVEATLGEEGISIDAGNKTTETLSKQFEVLTKSVLTCCDNLVKDAALAGEFDDEVIYAEEAVKNAVESFQNLGEACKSLKDSLSCHKNEDNMNVIGILADAITQIVADEEGVIEDEETADAEDDSNSVIDDVERRYSAPGGEQEEPEMGNEGPELGGEEEPEEF